MKTDKLRCLHTLLALGLGGWLGVWLLAGNLLLWQEVWQQPKAPSAQAGKLAPLASLLAAARHRHPEPGSWRFKLPNCPGEPVQAIFLADDLFAEAEPKVIWLDAYTAEVIGETTAKTLFWQALYRFHTSFLLGDRRRSVLIACGLILACLLGSGLALWRPARLNFSLRTCHRTLGLAIVPPLFISLISGLLLSLPTGWLSAALAPDQIYGLRSRLSPLTPEAVIAQVHARFPSYELRAISVPQHADEPWELAVHQPGSWDIEAAWLRFSFYPDGRLEARRASMREWVYALHTGQVIGIAGRGLLTLGGVGFAFQLIFGILIWQRAHFALAHARGHKQKATGD